MLDRRTQEIRSMDLDRGLAKSPARKRMEEDQDQSFSIRKRKKKLKHPILGEDWGEEIKSPPPPSLLVE